MPGPYDHPKKPWKLTARDWRQPQTGLWLNHLSKPINNPNRKLKGNSYEVVLVRNTGRTRLADRRTNSGARLLHNNTMPKVHQEESAGQRQG
jgi:hypothetical protein